MGCVGMYREVRGYGRVEGLWGPRMVQSCGRGVEGLRSSVQIKMLGFRVWCFRLWR